MTEEKVSQRASMEAATLEAAMQPLAQTVAGKPSKSLSFLVYKDRDCTNDSCQVQVTFDIKENKTLQDVYDHPRVFSGPRNWPADTLQALQNRDKKVKVILKDQDWKNQ